MLSFIPELARHLWGFSFLLWAPRASVLEIRSTSPPKRQSGFAFSQPNPSSRFRRECWLRASRRDLFSMFLRVIFNAECGKHWIENSGRRVSVMQQKIPVLFENCVKSTWKNNHPPLDAFFCRRGLGNRGYVSVCNKFISKDLFHHFDVRH